MHKHNANPKRQWVAGSSSGSHKNKSNVNNNGSNVTHVGVGESNVQKPLGVGNNCGLPNDGSTRASFVAATNFYVLLMICPCFNTLPQTFSGTSVPWL
ncbi:unnamed protein product [Ceratitis capitata]|uniref:(Mediterranean fruit fly) hypothetical protein n=1 Tax=Ceratitis capitata TaxID=7213 RepID=A0A811UFQ6_CERCA|nr:unnamed protein product [Ceratitis capitata]